MASLEIEIPQVLLGSVQTMELTQADIDPAFPQVATEIRRVGRQIDYVEVNLTDCSTGQLTDLIKFIADNLEKPIFENTYGPGVADGEDDIREALETPESILLMALDRKSSKPDVAGYLIGIPAHHYADWPNNVTTDNAENIQLPDEHTFYLHTLAVTPEARNRKVAYNLWNIFRRKVFPPLGKWQSLALFAMRQKDGNSYMLKFLDRALNLSRLKTEGRLSETVVTKFIDEKNILRDRLVPAHYVKIDLRGKFETALTIYPETKYI